MQKRFFVFFIASIVAILMLSACGSKKEETTTGQENENVEEVVGQEDAVEPEESSEQETKEEETSTSGTSGDFAELISYMEETTEGTAQVLYENKEPQVHETEGISISLNQYTLVELKDFHTNFEIPFNDQTDGGVILAQYTVTNQTDQDVHYTPFLDIFYTGAQKVYSNYKDLLPEDVQLPTKLGHSNDYLLKAGEEVTGYFAYPFGQDHLDEILSLATVEVDVPQALVDKDDFGSTIGKKGKFNLSLNTEGAEKVAASGTFYKDKATFDNMGEKKMLSEKEGINQSEQLGDVTVTLDGYQFTQFTPNSVEAPRFENFENGVVLLTVKFVLDNKAVEEVGLSSMSSKLTVNNGSQWLLNEGMLLSYGYSDVIEPGKTDELLQIYVLDQEQYEKIWKEKDFEVEIGPIKTKEAKDISKGKKATFVLPK